ncbi:MAG: glycosyltransferase family 39 protein [Methanotrichaceae archaeon]|nr:glycosyltransferase family 39 protein [Methanotrichaceae archaeon]
MERLRKYEILELMMLVLFSAAIRILAGKNSLIANGVLMNGYDEYYHMRRTLYTINHFPNVLWFDSYINYPNGFEITWPPLSDLLSAAFSLVLGQQSQSAAEKVTAVFLPIFLGSLVVVLVYYLVRELFDGKRAILAAFLTAIAPYFVQKTMIGATDHHGLEVLLALVSFFFLILALNRSEKMLVFSIASGITIACLAYTWFGAALYFGIMLIYAIIQMTLDLKHGLSSEETFKTIFIAYGVAAALLLPFWNAAWMRLSFLALIAYIIALVISFAISRQLTKKKDNWIIFLISLMAFGFAFLIISYLLADRPIFLQVLELIRYSEYLLGGQMVGMISEAEPLLSSPEILFSGKIFSNLGWILLFSLAGLFAVLLYMKNIEESRKKGILLFLVLSISLLILTLGQIRFLYFSNIIMCILISNFFFQILSAAEKKGLLNRERKNVVSFILLMVLILPFASEVFALSGETPPIAGDWYETLNWIEANTNATSWFNDPSKTPEYSIMSWWDYGNWIIYQGRRPVVANNFQVGISDASKFFLSNNEENAIAVMNIKGSRYVLTDYDMLYGKLPAIATWAKDDPAAYLRVKDFGSYIVAEPTEKLLGTTLAQLHFNDAASMGHFRLIYESSGMIGKNHPYNKVKLFEYVPGALIRIRSGPDKEIGAILNLTSNQGRFFQYFNVGKPVEGGYELRVPYSTGSRYQTQALNPYLIFSSNSEGARIMNIEVSEDEILEGRTINVDL